MTETKDSYKDFYPKQRSGKECEACPDDLHCGHDWREDYMPKVLNKYKDVIPKNAVYIGRPSKWGNPFVVGKDGTREEVIAKYRTWLLAQPVKVESAKRELAGKNLVCFCAPKGCHGDVLLEVANAGVTGVELAKRSP